MTWTAFAILAMFVEMIVETNKVPTYTVTQRTKRDSNSCSVFQQVSKVYNSYTLTFSTRRFFTTSYYVGVAATTCWCCDVGSIFKILWEQFNLLMGSGFWNLDYSSLIKYLGPEIHFLFDGISRFFFCPPAEIEILHSGMSVSQSVFWPTLNQMLYFIPTTMSDSLK